jgi:hypothetical protein
MRLLPKAAMACRRSAWISLAGASSSAPWQAGLKMLEFPAGSNTTLGHAASRRAQHFNRPPGRDSSWALHPAAGLSDTFAP